MVYEPTFNWGAQHCWDWFLPHLAGNCPMFSWLNLDEKDSWTRSSGKISGTCHSSLSIPRNCHFRRFPTSCTPPWLRRRSISHRPRSLSGSPVVASFRKKKSNLFGMPFIIAYSLWRGSLPSMKQRKRKTILWVEEILHHQKDGWNPINNGMLTTHQLVLWISQPSTVCFHQVTSASFHRGVSQAVSTLWTLWDFRANHPISCSLLGWIYHNTYIYIYVYIYI